MVVGAERRVKGPIRAAYVEKAREDGEERNDRVKVEACRLEPLGEADSVFLAIKLCALVVLNTGAFLSAAKSTSLRNCGMSLVDVSFASAFILAGIRCS